MHRLKTRGVRIPCTIHQGAQSLLASPRGRPRPSVARVSTAKQEGTLLRFHQGSSRSNACAPFSDQNLRNNGPLPNSEGCQQRLLPIKTSAPEGRVRPRVDASNDCSPWFMVQVHLTSRILRRCKGVLPRMRGGPWPLMGPRKPPKRRRRRPGAPRRADRAKGAQECEIPGSFNRLRAQDGKTSGDVAQTKTLTRTSDIGPRHVHRHGRRTAARFTPQIARVKTLSDG